MNLIVIAIIIALVVPIFLMGIIYPAFQIFLSEGNIVLTPFLRLTATIVMAIIDYGIAYIPIYYSDKRKHIGFNVICFILTLLWCMALGLLWYLSI